MFDLREIERDKMAVVHCDTKEKAEKFLKCLREQFPHKRFVNGVTHWDFYGSDTCYWLNFPNNDGLQYGTIGYAIEKNYHIYEVDSLMVMELPIEASDMDMKCLFGME